MTAFRTGNSLSLTDDHGTGSFLQITYGENGLQLAAVASYEAVDLELTTGEVEALAQFFAEVLRDRAGVEVYLLGRDEFRELVDEAEGVGFDKGYESGVEDTELVSDRYDEGYSDGFHDGHSEGESSGYERGLQEGSGDGYADGYAQGTSDEREANSY